MTVFELARLPRTALIAEYLKSRPYGMHGNGSGQHLESVASMSREQIVAAILGAQAVPKRLRTASK